MFDFFETLDEGVKCSIFADDIFIYCSHSSLEYIEKKLQNTVDNVYKWCTYWKLFISPEKSAIADLSKRRLLSTPRISYAGSPLPWKDSIKYLGIIFSKTNQNGAIIKNLRAKALRKSMHWKQLPINRTNLRSFFFRIHPINSNFTAEALAICQAIDDLSVPDSDFLIFTDSFSVLQALKNLSIKSPKVILRLAHKILMRAKFNQKIALVWILGHSNITWNERADSPAKNVTETDLYIDWKTFVHTIVICLFKND
ncbi:hypothetical protein AVEN_77943-1 [Araneus ventricosus]|uniref:RNase H type-1 domain-containing protein n=1 Tax=Araneus ventricosus TaxID=182803 RepID=A0A4Y2DVC4_ARAVE|nr:hypothetical protein AVEN_77943-1 [Araneus ventricosus]